MINIKKVAYSVILSLAVALPNLSYADAATNNDSTSVVTQSSQPTHIVTPEQAKENVAKANAKSQHHGSVQFDFWTGQEPEIPYSVFEKDVNEHLVQEVIFSGNIMQNLEAKVLLKDGSRYSVYLVARNSDDFLENLSKNGVVVNVVKDFSALNDQRFFQQGTTDPSVKNKVLTVLIKVWNMLLTLIYMLLYIIVFIFLMLWIQKKMMGMSGSRFKKVNPKDIDVSFKDIAGNEEAKRDIMEVVEFLKDKKKFNKLGAKIPKGILLLGDPGNGKTMFAKAIAKESGSAFFQCSGSEFDEVYVGLGASRVRELFKKARKAGKAVIFIDEIDAVGKSRSLSSNSGSEQTLNQLLTMMDGFDSSKHEILIVAATNRIDVLDEALIRPGRFDRKIQVNRPSEQGRFEILNVYLNKVKDKESHVAEDIDVRTLAKLTVGFSGAELANLVNEALIRAAKTSDKILRQEHLMKARTKLMLGDPRVDIKMIEKERELTAYHEAGHAVLALAVSKDPVEQITITPHGMALGLVLQVPERESWMITKEDILAKIKVLMAGRAAEEVFLKKCSTGASNDMERAYELALNMCVKWGMGNVLGGISVKNMDSLSQNTRHDVDHEVIDIVNSSFDLSKQILIKESAVIEDIVKVLLEKETLDKSEIMEIWEKHRTEI